MVSSKDFLIYKQIFFKLVTNYVSKKYQNKKQD